MSSGDFEGVFKDSCYHFLGIPYAKFQKRWEESSLIEEKLEFCIKKRDSSPQTRFRDENHSSWFS